MSKTSEVSVYKFSHSILGDLVLVDIPGEDENRRLYMKKGRIMEMVARQLFIDVEDVGSYLSES